MSRVIEEIDKFYSEYSLLDYASKLSLLIKERQKLYNLAYQMSLLHRAKGYFSQHEELQAQRLMEAINFVQKEGDKTAKDLMNECLNKYLKSCFK